MYVCDGVRSEEGSVRELGCVRVERGVVYMYV